MDNFLISPYEKKAIEENQYTQYSDSFDEEFGQKQMMDFTEEFTGNFNMDSPACGYIFVRYKNGDAKTREVIDKTLIDLCGMPLVRLCREKIGTEGKFY